MPPVTRLCLEWTQLLPQIPSYSRGSSTSPNLARYCAVFTFLWRQGTTTPHSFEKRPVRPIGFCRATRILSAPTQFLLGQQIRDPHPVHKATNKATELQMNSCSELLLTAATAACVCQVSTNAQGVSVLPSSLWAARAGINGRWERRGLSRSLAQGVNLEKGARCRNFEGGRDPGAAALAVPTPRWDSGAIEQAELTRDFRTSPGFALNCTVSFTALQKRMPRN